MKPSSAEIYPAYRAYARSGIDRVPQFQRLGEEQRLALKTVSAVLPFKVNNYVVEELINWDDVPNDPMYQLTFPQEGMLDPDDFRRVRELVRSDANNAELAATVDAIRRRLNPHPGGQRDLNVPHLDGEPVAGLQHKYRETVLYFPGQGQTCHAYCTYCFRWAQFVGSKELTFASSEVDTLVRYLEQHPEVTDVLITGGDPMVMRTRVLRRYVEPLLEVESLSSIRIGTKSVAWWPYRFLAGDDADDLLRLFEQVVARGKHLALMAHYSHPRELSTPASQNALRRILTTGAVVRCQAPLVRRVNDSPELWAELWKRQVRAGAVPYYMFVARDTGPKDYFKVPLARALEIYQEAARSVSGLARTARGPTMSCTPGKVQVVGRTEVGGERLFVLKILQARDPAWVHKLLFARYDEQAAWLNELQPALGGDDLFTQSWRSSSNVNGGDVPDSLMTRPGSNGRGALPLANLNGRGLKGAQA